MPKGPKYNLKQIYGYEEKSFTVHITEKHHLTLKKLKTLLKEQNKKITVGHVMCMAIEALEDKLDDKQDLL